MPIAQLNAVGPVLTLRQETSPTRSVSCSTINVPPSSPSNPDSDHCLRLRLGSVQPCHPCSPAATGPCLRPSSQDRSSSVTGRRVTRSPMAASLQLTATASAAVTETCPMPPNNVGWACLPLAENQVTSAHCLGKVGPMPELKRLHAGHAPAVLAFELANRAYFAASISDRGDDFFAQFTGRYNALLAEQEAGMCACYVLVAEDGSVLGRFNLVDIEDHTAELGYRVAQHVTGRGVATATVRELCRLAAARHGLRTLRAATARQNVASQKVLTKAGFVAVGPADPAHLGGKPGTWYQRDLVL